MNILVTVSVLIAFLYIGIIIYDGIILPQIRSYRDKKAYKRKKKKEEAIINSLEIGSTYLGAYLPTDLFIVDYKAEEATILDIKTNSENTKYVKVMIDNRIEIMDAFLFIKRFDKKIIKI